MSSSVPPHCPGGDPCPTLPTLPLPIPFTTASGFSPSHCRLSSCPEPQLPCPLSSLGDSCPSCRSQLKHHFPRPVWGHELPEGIHAAQQGPWPSRAPLAGRSHHLLLCPAQNESSEGRAPSWPLALGCPVLTSLAPGHSRLTCSNTSE